ncbi:hypothetical protein CDIK_1625 [Cucumispora dikerogammari]|nr:hypothetical protein CDIK_1625 [Cucumispora dikerogammari]
MYIRLLSHTFSRNNSFPEALSLSKYGIKFPCVDYKVFDPQSLCEHSSIIFGHVALQCILDNCPKIVELRSGGQNPSNYDPFNCIRETNEREEFCRFMSTCIILIKICES